MNKELKEAIDFINEWGINDSKYIAKNVKNFMNCYNEADDNSCDLADEHYYQLEIVIKAGLNLDQLLQQAKEEEYNKGYEDCYFELTGNNLPTPVADYLKDSKE